MSENYKNLAAQAAHMSASYVELMKRAYEIGFTEGGLAMREQILMAANAPMLIKDGVISTAERAGTSILYPDQSRTTGRVADSGRFVQRAPRGAVQSAVDEVLRSEPGLSIIDIEERVVTSHPEIARKSVGNQLRRFEGAHYRRDGKYNWFLISTTDQEASSPSDEEELDLLEPERKGGEAT